MQEIRLCVEKGYYRLKAHQKQREQERCITRAEVLYVLKNGKNNAGKGGFDTKNQRETYAICGRTIDGRMLEVIVAFDQVDRNYYYI